MSSSHLAQVNIARLREPLTAPLLRDFVDWLEPVNARADAAPGFVWRLKDESGDATALAVFDDTELIVNMSVWTSVEALRAFAFADEGHLAVLRRRREWFHRMAEAYSALWWIPAGHVPTVAEAERPLVALRTNGPSPAAFTFRHLFPPPTGAGAEGEPVGADVSHRS